MDVKSSTSTGCRNQEPPSCGCFFVQVKLDLYKLYKYSHKDEVKCRRTTLETTSKGILFLLYVFVQLVSQLVQPFRNRNSSRTMEEAWDDEFLIFRNQLYLYKYIYIMYFIRISKIMVHTPSDHPVMRWSHCTVCHYLGGTMVGPTTPVIYLATHM